MAFAYVIIPGVSAARVRETDENTTERVINIYDYFMRRGGVRFTAVTRVDSFMKYEFKNTMPHNIITQRYVRRKIIVDASRAIVTFPRRTRVYSVRIITYGIPTYIHVNS